MFRKGNPFIFGILFLVASFGLNMVLPKWVGAENGPIENIQLLWLFAGFYKCYKLSKEELPDWGGKQKALWYAGMVFFFMIIMREINWGRAILVHPDGTHYKYSEMGLYGKMVHPMVAMLICAFAYLCYKGKAWLFVMKAKLPAIMTLQLGIYITIQWFAEHHKFKSFEGDVAEELTEFGIYMITYFLLEDLVKAIKRES